MMIFNILRKILDPRYADKQVELIQAKNKKVFEDTAKVAKRHADLLKKNGVTMRIYIATGGDKHGH